MQTLQLLLGDQIIYNFNNGSQLLPKLIVYKRLDADVRTINFGKVQGLMYLRVGDVGTPGLYMVNTSNLTEILSGSTITINDSTASSGSSLYKNSNNELILQHFYGSGRDVDLWFIVCREVAA